MTDDQIMPVVVPGDVVGFQKRVNAGQAGKRRYWSGTGVVKQAREGRVTVRASNNYFVPDVLVDLVDAAPYYDGWWKL